MNGTVLIAGAGLGGSRCAETLRARGWDGTSCSSATSSTRLTNGQRSRRSCSAAGGMT